MAERILGPKGPERKKRLKFLPLLLIAAFVLLIGATQASGAFGPTKTDEQGPNDVPGQKDLNSQAVDETGLPNTLLTRWNWDEITTSGANTLDACSLLDSDGDGFANFAVCATTQGQANNFASTTTLYSCGDTRVDRCASQIAVLPTTNGSSCTTVLSNTDPYPGPAAKQKGAAYPNDTQATCTIQLADLAVGGVTINDLELINTCSYPSQQPNSDPSDCVLIPRDAKIVIVKDAGGDTTTTFPFTVTEGSTSVFSGNISAGTLLASRTVNIIGGHTYVVAEGTVPSGWEFVSGSCTGSTATGGNGTPGKSITVKAVAGDTITCTFTNALAPFDATITTAPSVIPQDSATLNIDETGDGTGDLTFTLYSDSTCTTSVYTQTIQDIATDGTYKTTNSGDPASTPAGYSITADGKFYWKVHYAGDDRNNAVTSDCVEIADVDLTADPSS
jgi:hypothetical protein